MEAALAYLKGKGVTKIGVMGFCYGGHPACYASATWPADVACGVVVHPSMQLETFAFGGDTAALLKQVTCPFFIAPAGNDLPMWAADGEFGAALKASARGGEAAWRDFPEMQHGWTVRGDLADAAVARDAALALSDAAAFFARYLGGPA